MKLWKPIMPSDVNKLKMSLTFQPITFWYKYAGRKTAMSKRLYFVFFCPNFLHVHTVSAHLNSNKSFRVSEIWCAVKCCPFALYLLTITIKSDLKKTSHKSGSSVPGPRQNMYFSFGTNKSVIIIDEYDKWLSGRDWQKTWGLLGLLLCDWVTDMPKDGCTESQLLTSQPGKIPMPPSTRVAVTAKWFARLIYTWLSISIKNLLPEQTSQSSQEFYVV